MSKKPRGNFTMSKNFSQLREYAYRACIPYYIFWDKELTLNHHRLYCLIEQMESDPNPKVKPTFSYQWFADLIGIDVRSAKRIAQTLKRKKYIEHVRLSDNTWIWRTVKNIGLQDGEDVKIKTELDIFDKKKKGAVKAPNNPTILTQQLTTRSQSMLNNFKHKELTHV